MLTENAYSISNIILSQPSHKSHLRPIAIHTERDYFFGGQSIYWYSTEYDLIHRPTNDTDAVSIAREWLYNRRSEFVVATIGTNS
ncbi:MAG: hypothetical protein ACI4QT_00505 [Kiritimatiellia bacterium]